MHLRRKHRTRECQESGINLTATSGRLDILAERPQRDLSTHNAVVAEGRGHGVELLLASELASCSTSTIPP